MLREKFCICIGLGHLEIGVELVVREVIERVKSRYLERHAVARAGMPGARQLRLAC